MELCQNSEDGKESSFLDTDTSDRYVNLLEYFIYLLLFIDKVGLISFNFKIK